MILHTVLRLAHLTLESSKERQQLVVVFPTPPCDAMYNLLCGKHSALE